ncbi:MAG: hypothetical protein R3C05_20115 [Pirellulaceae bacterium]
MTSTDVEGDAVTYAAFNQGTVGYTTSVNQSTGAVTVTPPAGYSGTFNVLVGVSGKQHGHDSRFHRVRLATRFRYRSGGSNRHHQFEFR